MNEDHELSPPRLPVFPHLFRRYFDRIAVISLPSRVDRRERVLAHLLDTGLAAAEDLTWVDAVDGASADIPAWWTSGSGAWGCRASHWRTIAAAQRDGIGSLLILEDDVVFHPRTREWLPEVHGLLPEDWDLFFLGGQHLQPALGTGDARLVKGCCITRTHAWALRSKAFGRVLMDLGNDARYRAHPGWHIDHFLGNGQSIGKWNAYAPSWWFAGQDEGASNISRNQDRRRWWQTGEYYWQLPFIIPPAGSESHPCLCPARSAPPTDPLHLALWLRDAARAAWQEGRLPCCDLPPQAFRHLWPAGIRSPRDSAELTRLADYPANGLFAHPFSQNQDR